jgi:hypothetical protein
VSLPANANVISATTSQGTLFLNGTFAELGNIPTGTNVVVTIVVSPTITGNITASAKVALGANVNEIDPVTYNNYASVLTTVGPAADLGVTAFATPNPVVEGNNLGYIGTISNTQAWWSASRCQRGAPSFRAACRATPFPTIWLPRPSRTWPAGQA